jgi:hypothetical protein
MQFGQLGIFDMTQRNTFTKIPFPSGFLKDNETVVDVISSGEQSFLLTSHRQVISFGKNVILY